MPRVVMAGVPTRQPPGLRADLSPGTLLRFTLMLTASHTCGREHRRCLRCFNEAVFRSVEDIPSAPSRDFDPLSRHAFEMSSEIDCVPERFLESSSRLQYSWTCRTARCAELLL